MHRASAFQVEGVVTEAFANGTYRVQLANGHCLLGFVSGQKRQPKYAFVPGTKVELSLTPYDLSSGRILVDRKNNLI